MKRLLPALFLALALFVAPSRSEAASLSLGLGAHYWLRSGGVFPFDLSIEQYVARQISVGGRFGVAIATAGGGAVGIPLDILFNVDITRQLYLQLAGGPWIFFGGDASVHAHIAFGFGLKAGIISFGPEVGYLQPNGIFGFKLAFNL